MSPIEILVGFFLCFVSIQVFFSLFVFSRLLFVKTNISEQQPPVSVIVCAWNELDNLKRLLPVLDTQDYPNYEVIIMDDRSSDGSEDFLSEYCLESNHVRTIRISEEHKYITPKKYAITIAQKHSLYDLSLFTDADCVAIGPNWISSMVNQLESDKEIVLGFSPYEEQGGLLNWFIRCETFYTAVQYLSFALTGIPYMAVGRNLLYRKELFFKNKGFYKHHKIMGGDDDLFINEVATGSNVAVNMDPDSFMYSQPKETWGEWLYQKRRHLGVGKLYRTRNKLLLGLLSGSHVMTWLFFVALIAYGACMKDILLLQVVGVTFLARLVIQWLILGLINKRLDSTISSFVIPFMDFALFLYFLFIGGKNLIQKQTVTRWR